MLNSNDSASLIGVSSKHHKMATLLLCLQLHTTEVFKFRHHKRYQRDGDKNWRMHLMRGKTLYKQILKFKGRSCVVLTARVRYVKLRYISKETPHCFPRKHVQITKKKKSQKLMFAVLESFVEESSVIGRILSLTHGQHSLQAFLPDMWYLGRIFGNIRP